VSAIGNENLRAGKLGYLDATCQILMRIIKAIMLSVHKGWIDEWHQQNLNEV